MAERERHAKYRRQDEEREVVRQPIREKVDTVTYIDAKCNTSVCVKYNIEKPATEDDEEEDEDDFAFGQKRLEDNQDAISSENYTFVANVILQLFCAQFCMCPFIFIIPHKYPFTAPLTH